jgi:hypothetical protein
MYIISSKHGFMADQRMPNVEGVWLGGGNGAWNSREFWKLEDAASAAVAASIGHGVTCEVFEITWGDGDTYTTRKAGVTVAV